MYAICIIRYTYLNSFWATCNNWRWMLTLRWWVWERRTLVQISSDDIFCRLKVADTHFYYITYCFFRFRGGAVPSIWSRVLDPLNTVRGLPRVLLSILFWTWVTVLESILWILLLDTGVRFESPVSFFPVLGLGTKPVHPGSGHWCAALVRSVQLSALGVFWRDQFCAQSLRRLTTVLYQWVAQSRNLGRADGRSKTKHCARLLLEPTHETGSDQKLRKSSDGHRRIRGPAPFQILSFLFLESCLRFFGLNQCCTQSRPTLNHCDVPVSGPVAKLGRSGWSIPEGNIQQTRSTWSHARNRFWSEAEGFWRAPSCRSAGTFLTSIFSLSLSL